MVFFFRRLHVPSKAAPYASGKRDRLKDVADFYGNDQLTGTTSRCPHAKKVFETSRDMHSMERVAAVISAELDAVPRLDIFDALSGDARAMRLVAEAAIQTAERNAQNTNTERSALCTLLEMSSESSRVHLLKSFGNDKYLPHALAVLRCSPDSSSCLYNAAIDACIECRSVDDARQVFADAVQAGAADMVTYNTIVKAYLQAKQYSDARNAVESMKAAGLRPNSVTYNEILEYLVKHNIEDAWPLLDDMRTWGVKPTRITCAIMLKAVQTNSQTTDVDRVISMCSDIDEELDEVLLASVVDACIRVGRVDALIPQLKTQRSRIQIKSSHTYASIIRAYGFVRDVAGCWCTWREMRTRHIQPCAVTLGCMVEALVTNGEVEAGYELINEMLRDHEWTPQVNAVVYCSVLKGFSHQKKIDRMWQVYQEMLEHKLKFSIVTFNTLVDACARNGQMQRIPPMLDDMGAQGIPPNIITYSAIVKGYCQAGRVNDAFAVLEGMVTSTRFTPDEIMYNTLLDGCARQGMIDRGIQLLSRMESDCVPPSNFTLSVLVKLCNRGKQLDRAFDLCNSLSAKYRFLLNAHVYSNLVHGCIIHKDTHRAFAVIEKMLSQTVRPDLRTYTILLKACVEEKKADDAAGLIRAAFGLANAHPRLIGYDRKLLQPQGGLLSVGLVTEILEGIAGLCSDEQLAMALLKELRVVPALRFDPKLHFRLATSAFKKQSS